MKGFYFFIQIDLVVINSVGVTPILSLKALICCVCSNVGNLFVFNCCKKNLFF